MVYFEVMSDGFCFWVVGNVNGYVDMFVDQVDWMVIDIQFQVQQWIVGEKVWQQWRDQLYGGKVCVGDVQCVVGIGLLMFVGDFIGDLC